MTEDLIRDILNASDAIDDALSIMTKENRGKPGVRNLHSWGMNF